MKVLLVSPFSTKMVGGIINWTKYIVNYHRENGGDVELTVLYNKNATQVFGTSNPIRRLFVGLSNYLPIVRHFKEKVVNEQFDVAHICTSGSLGLIRDLMIVKIAKKNGVKTVVHMHFGRVPQILASRGWETVLLKGLLRRTDCVVVMDSFSLKALRERKYKNIRFVPNPLPTEVQKIIESLGVTKRDSRKILYAGHVLPSKGLKELVKACREIYQVKLEIIGKVSDEAFREQLYQIGGEGSRNWLAISGNKSFDAVIKEMKSCSVFVLPSYSEGFPNVILESMACECPIVATPVGAIPEMLDVASEKPCGVCVPQQNFEALRDAIVDLLGKPMKASALGENARKRVNEQYAIPKIWEQLEAVWRNV